MSRQPPPPGVPSRSNDYARENTYRPRDDEYRGQGDRYARDRRYNDYNRSPPPPPMYEFRGGRQDDRHYDRYDRRSSRYDDRNSPPRNRAPDAYRPRDEGFTFRQEAPSSIDFRHADVYRRSPPRDRNRNNNNLQRGGRGRGVFRGRGGPRLASERDFLKGNRAPTPELMPGMDEEVDSGVRYKPAEDVSDSDETDMVLSEDDDQPRKKQLRTESKAADGDSVPRWSNPDPYTALPPPDETQRKKKDVVKLIRKARVNATTENITKADAGQTDFISFDFDGAASAKSSDDGYEPAPDVAYGNGVVGAPKGPAALDKNTEIRGAPGGPRTALPQRHPNLPARPPLPEPVTFQQEAKHVQFHMNAQPAAPRSFPGKQVSIDLTADSPENVKKVNAINMAPTKVQEQFQTDESLGSMKRNIRGEIKGPPRIHAPSMRKPQSKGNILPEWRPLANTNSTPWIVMDHSQSASMGIWLHKEIMDFYHFVKPKKFENVIRTKLVEDLNARLRNSFDDAEVHTFGSFPAGLYLPTADMDLVLASQQYLKGGYPIHGQSRSSLTRFGIWLGGEKVVLRGTLDVISKAKVPLVKYVDGLTGLKVDISFENTTGLTANKTFQEWKTQFPVMPIIVTIIKHLLAMRGLNEPVNGGIGGFSVTCLVVSLLQLMPQVQNGNMIPEHHTNEILMEFFDLYGNEFNSHTTAIRLDPPSYISKARANVSYKGPQEKFMILDPNNPDNDISGGASNTSTIRQVFSEAHQLLQDTMASLQRTPNRRNKSILGCILAGNYSSFKLQRDHLQHVHEKLLGPIENE